MTGKFVPFDAIWPRVVESVESTGIIPEPVYLVRNLHGQVRVSVSEALEDDASRREVLARLAADLRERLGRHGKAPDGREVLFVPDSLLENARATAREIRPGVYLVDRLVTGGGWWTVGEPVVPAERRRVALFAVKGGVGRSTTAVVLARHLAAEGGRVLVVDLDLESPGLSSAMLESRELPTFGVTDWFVEDLVGQGEQVIGDMTAEPAWAQGFEGDVHVAPAHGRESGEYLAKLGRVYMDAGEAWTARLQRLLSRLEASCAPTVVLLESRSGLHDIAAATVTDLGAHVLLFAIDSESSWTDYEILFRHWQRHAVASKIRERLSIVSALTPADESTERYLEGFRERAWDLFRTVYDDVSGESTGFDDPFSFDLADDEAPHHPMAIHWTRGLAAGASLRNPTTITDPVNQAYAEFLRHFERLVGVEGGGGPR